MSRVEAVLEARDYIEELLGKAPKNGPLAEALALADEILVDLKGDAVGHEFHGNRFTGGIGGGGSGNLPFNAHGDQYFEALNAKGQEFVTAQCKKFGVTPDAIAKEVEGRLRNKDGTPNTAILKEGAKWYPMAHELTVKVAESTQDLAHPVTPERVAAVLALLSPQTPWEANSEVGARVSQWFASGRADGLTPEQATLAFKAEWEREGYGGKTKGSNYTENAKLAMMNNQVTDAMAALMGVKSVEESLTSPKQRSFANNIMLPGQTKDVTVDVQMQKAITYASRDKLPKDPRVAAESGQDTGRTVSNFFDSKSVNAAAGPGYVAVATGTRIAAARLGVSPDVAQAAYWIVVQDQTPPNWPRSTGATQTHMKTPLVETLLGHPFLGTAASKAATEWPLSVDYGTMALTDEETMTDDEVDGVLADEEETGTKGDEVGHEFHGNRYTGGIGGTPDANPRLRVTEALEAVLHAGQTPPPSGGKLRPVNLKGEVRQALVAEAMNLPGAMKPEDYQTIAMKYLLAENDADNLRLSKEETNTFYHLQEAMSEYETSSAWDMNSELRRPGGSAEQGMLNSGVREMDMAFEKFALPFGEDTVVCRGAVMPPPTAGTVYHDEAYISTIDEPGSAIWAASAQHTEQVVEMSGVESRGASTLWAITVPADAPVLAVRPSELQNSAADGRFLEVLLPRGANFRVDSVEKRSGSYFVKATYLNSTPTITLKPQSHQRKAAPIPSDQALRILWLPGDMTITRPGKKYSEDQPRDDHGRWGAGDSDYNQQTGKDRVVAGGEKLAWPKDEAGFQAMIADVRKPGFTMDGAAITPTTDLIVFHSTEPDNSKLLYKYGFTSEDKPMNLARSRFEAGEPTVFAPGAGLNGGLYVTSDPNQASGYGHDMLAVRVRVGDLSVPVEGGYTDPVKALISGGAGAVINGPIPPENIRRFGTDRRMIPKPTINELKDGKIEGVKYSDDQPRDDHGRFGVSGSAGGRPGKPYAVVDKHDPQGGRGMRRVSFHATAADARAEAQRLNARPPAAEWFKPNANEKPVANGWWLDNNAVNSGPKGGSIRVFNLRHESRPDDVFVFERASEARAFAQGHPGGTEHKAATSEDSVM